MRAFLSHSSKDKGFVEGLAGYLRPGTYELDSETFDAGIINSAAIIRALERTTLFCLFLSEEALKSSFVDFETLLGVEFLARGRVHEILVVCLDDNSFEHASTNVKLFNIVRKALTLESAARLVQGHLISSSAEASSASHPFVGREAELLELERQVTNHDRPTSKAIFISGNYGSGRRTVARKFYEDQFPRVNRMFPVIAIEPFAGLEELYRRTLSDLRPSMSVSELRTRIQGFAISSDEDKKRSIASLFNSLLTGREAAILFDKGGVLTDGGALEPEIDGIVNYLESRPYPPVIIVAPRMIPRRVRRAADDLSYVAVRSLNRDAGIRA